MTPDMFAEWCEGGPFDFCEDEGCPHRGIKHHCLPPFGADREDQEADVNRPENSYPIQQNGRL